MGNAEVLRVALAGVPCELVVDGELPAHILDRYRAYACAGEPVLRCSIACEPDFWLTLDEEALYPAARCDVEGQRYHLRRHDFEAHLDLATGVLRVRSQPTLALEAALRIAIALVLPQQGGLLLHSSGVIEAGQGYVFSGASGVGKTTTVRLLSPRTPLGDDLVALVPDGDGFRAIATPFAGEYGVVAPVAAPLARLYFLEQAEVHERLPLDAAGVRLHLLRNTLSYARDVATVGKLQDVVDRIARRVPSARVRFRRDPGIAQWLDAPLRA